MLPSRRKLSSILLLWVGIAGAGPAEPPLVLNCFGCHGPDGQGSSDESGTDYMPSITGLNLRYFLTTLSRYKRDERASTVMGRIAKGYSTGELQLMALYFGTRPWNAAPAAVDPTLAARGRELHREYCEKCHKDEGRRQDKDTPRLAGQSRGYLRLQMQDYRAAVPNLPQPPVMQERIEKLGDADLDALAAFYAGRD